MSLLTGGATVVGGLVAFALQDATPSTVSGRADTVSEVLGRTASTGAGGLISGVWVSRRIGITIESTLFGRR
jgi:hypothetical protein